MKIAPESGIILPDLAPELLSMIFVYLSTRSQLYFASTSRDNRTRFLKKILQSRHPDTRRYTQYYLQRHASETDLEEILDNLSPTLNHDPNDTAIFTVLRIASSFLLNAEFDSDLFSKLRLFSMDLEACIEVSRCLMPYFLLNEERLDFRDSLLNAIKPEVEKKAFTAREQSMLVLLQLNPAILRADVNARTILDRGKNGMIMSNCDIMAKQIQAITPWLTKSDQDYTASKTNGYILKGSLAPFGGNYFLLPEFLMYAKDLWFMKLEKNIKAAIKSNDIDTLKLTLIIKQATSVIPYLSYPQTLAYISCLGDIEAIVAEKLIRLKLMEDEELVFHPTWSLLYPIRDSLGLLETRLQHRFSVFPVPEFIKVIYIRIKDDLNQLSLQLTTDKKIELSSNHLAKCLVVFEYDDIFNILLFCMTLTNDNIPENKISWIHGACPKLPKILNLNSKLFQLSIDKKKNFPELNMAFNQEELKIISNILDEAHDADSLASMLLSKLNDLLMALVRSPNTIKQIRGYKSLVELGNLAKPIDNILDKLIPLISCDTNISFLALQTIEMVICSSLVDDLQTQNIMSGCQKILHSNVVLNHRDAAAKCLLALYSKLNRHEYRGEILLSLWRCKNLLTYNTKESLFYHLSNAESEIISNILMITKATPFSILMEIRIKLPIEISQQLNIPFKQALSLVGALRSYDVEKTTKALLQIVKPCIDNPDSGRYFTTIATLVKLIKDEQSQPIPLAASMGEGLNFVSTENDLINTLRAAALKIVSDKKFAEDSEKTNFTAIFN